MAARLRVVIATPLEEELVALIAEREPRLEIAHRPELMAPASADWMVRPERDDAQQAEYEAYLDGGEALFGVPDQSGRALAAAIGRNPALRWVHTIPAGGGAQVRAARLDEAALERVAFTTSAGVHAQPLSEFALLGVLAGFKHLPRLREAQGRREWAHREPMVSLTESRVAVVGLGGIGRRTASLLSGLGVEVIGVHRREVEADVARIEPVERLGEVLAGCDAVVLALPATDATRHMLNREVLAKAKPGIAVVNVGRGTTIDEAALVEAIERGQVGSATLDVTEVEPLPAESPLWGLEQVVIAPHTAAISPHEPRRIAELFADNASRLLDGRPLRNLVDTVEFY
ncbi:D-2-hydroxyacid dehydrogenase [Homoserinibacter sp. YIM 151385]|uniref:D-2-hydroxyacid dehydrogenase n=1 Tax=Homoserinibacter sp. YIM 151385 TaxID=2985506 RepID=UPI0022EFDE17|nr:D-2-hydroxyacid dehydrogenase [Homoserinibacter sp. YIM 151385]WBU38014.1 D-2-hydroxyacid dehydrogenase [Homoserinibacter sp. YIM 151385]